MPDPILFHFFSPSAWLTVSGEDAATFLQGQFSNDLRPLEAGRATYGLWLNHKGRVLADSHVLQIGPNEFRLFSCSSAAEEICERLESFIIADDVTVGVTGCDWSAFFVGGVGAAEFMTECGLPVPEAGHFSESGDVYVFPGRRSADPAYEVLCPSIQADAWRERLRVAGASGRARELDESEVAYERIQAGIPLVPVDVGPGDLPQEGGLERDAVAFEKGCYLGQEVMARLRSMGQVRRRLIRVSLAEMPVSLPAELYANGRKAGELRSASANETAGSLGLALVSIQSLRDVSGYALTAEGQVCVEPMETKGEQS